MNRRGINWPVPLLLLVVCAALAYPVFEEIANPTPLPEAPPQKHDQVQAGQAPDSPTFQLPPLDDFDETLARPLFTSSRRPSEEQETEEPVPSVAPEIVLLGVIITSEYKSAIVRGGHAGAPDELVEGQGIQGWVLTTIAPDHIILSNGSEKQVYRIDPPPDEPGG